MNRKSLRQSEIKHILKLQELFHNRFLNEELLNQLVSLYVKSIGSLGQSISLMKVYFLQKMQFLLSRPEIQRLLNQEQSEKSTTDKYTIKISNLEMQYQCEKYVRKLSLHSQPVGPKLSEMSDEEEKIRERQNRIRNQLQLMREIELSVNQISLQKRQKQSDYVPSRKINQSDFEEEEVNLNQKVTNRKRIVRKNSDCFKSKSQIHEMFDGKEITKEYLLSIQKQTNSKVEQLGLNADCQYPKLNEGEVFSRRNFKFESFCQNQKEIEGEGLQKFESDERHEDKNNENSKLRDSFEFGTFAPGYNTPKFREQSYQSPKKIGHTSFPKPLEQSTDTSLLSRKKEIRDKEDEDQQQALVHEEESQKDYKDDEYF